MIKDFNSFITEDKEYNEIFTLVEEVLSNDYSNREIEESFDEFNLLLESISMDDIKKYVNIAKSDENLQKLFKMRDDFKKDYDSLEKELIKSLEDKKISREEFREKLQAAYKEYQDTLKKNYLDNLEMYKDDDDKVRRGKLCSIIYSLYDFINNIFKKSFKKWYVDAIAKNRFDTEEDKVTKESDDWENLLYNTVKEYVEDINKKYDELKITDNEREFVREVYKELKLIGDKYSPLQFDQKTGNMVASDKLKQFIGVIISDIIDEVESDIKSKEDVSDVISDNKDLLTPLAKEANVTADQLSNIVSKLCLTKTGKSRKLDSGVVTGLSIIICGVLLTVKKNGKNDRKAIVDVINKISELIEQKKGFKKILQ